jgi:hypothetical protein
MPTFRFFQGNCCAYPFRKKKGAIFGMEGVAVNADAVSKPGSLCSLYEERMGVMKSKGDRVNNP